MSEPVRWNELTARERDALVAEKVMEWTNMEPPRPSDGVHGGVNEYGQLAPVPPYTTSIAAAWRVVEKMGDTPGPNGDHHDLSLWRIRDRTLAVFAENEEWEAKAFAPTAPEAICIAALRACGVEVDTDAA